MENVEREKIVNKIVDDFEQCRLSSYWFPKSRTQIEWSTHQEIYLILHQDKTWDYAEPKHLDMYVEDLKDQDLKNDQHTIDMLEKDNEIGRLMKKITERGNNVK